MSWFDRACDIVLGLEGGLVDNPADPGGLTNMGISQRAYPTEDIRGLTVDRAKFLYRRDYYMGAWDSLPWWEAFLAFTCAVNQGQGRAEKILALTSGKPKEQFIPAFQAERALSYAAQPSWINFGRGWMRRLFIEALAAEGT